MGSKPVLKSIVQVSDELGISKSIIYNKIANGKIIPSKNPNGKGSLLSFKEIEKLKKMVTPRPRNNG